MANRRRPRQLDWTSFDEFYNNFSHKEANLELLDSGNPEYYQIFQAQDPEVQERILAGAVSLQEMQEQQMRMSDPGFVPNQVEPLTPMPLDPVSIENAAGAAEVAGTADLIQTRFDALTSHVGGMRDVIGGSADFTELDKLREYETPEARAKAREELLSKRGNPQRLAALAATGDVGAGAILKELERIEEAERVFTTPGEFDRRLQAAGSQNILGSQEVKRAEEYYDRTGNIGTRTVGDIASQPEMGLSVVGGLAGGLLGKTPQTATLGAAAGSVPMAKMAYDTAYTEARLAGISPEDANKFGLLMSSTEFLLEAASGKLAGGLGIKGVIKERLKQYIPELAAKAGTRAAITGGGAAAVGYGEEFLTEALQDVASLGYAELAEDPKFAAFLRGNVSRDQFGNIDYDQIIKDYNRAGLAGGTFGGAVGTGGGYVRARVEQEVRAQQAILNNTISDPAARERYARVIEQAAEATNRIKSDLPAPLGPTPVEEAQRQHNQLFGTTPTADPLNPGTILDTIGAQYRDVGGGLSLPVAGPLTAAERGKFLEAGPRTPLEAPTKPVEPTKVTTPPATTPKKKKAKKPLTEAPTQSSVLGKIKDLGLESKASKAALTKQPGRKSSNVIRALSRMGTSDSESTLDLINAGKLGIVDTEADLPDGLERGRDGWYDPRSKRIWLVASNLSPKDVRGTALHEINHFLNRNKKDKTTRTGISKLISGNLDTYNNRIKNLAKEGNSVAKEALRLAEEDGNVTEELTSYFATAALAKIESQGALGRAGQLFKDLKSAINTTARNRGIGELSDNDISYILRRQAEDAPSVEFTDGETEGLRTNSPELASIIGSRSPSYEDTVRKFPEREYKGRLDNRPRVEISDRKATMAPIGPRIKELLERPNGLAISAILQHKDLYDAYPDPLTTKTRIGVAGLPGMITEFPFKFKSIADVRVRINPKLEAGAYYTAYNDTITISPQLATSPRLKSLLLHEIQHAIQARENFASGADATALYQEELKNLAGVKAPEGFDGTDEQYRAKKARARAWQRYSRTYGEAEARLSEGNLNLTDAELSEVLPEERMTEQIENLDGTIANKQLSVADTLPGGRPIMRAEARSLPAGLASIKSQRGGEFAPAFITRILPDALVSLDVQGDAIWAKFAADYHRILKNYLSRWAGTIQDPLNSIRLPQFGDATWEEGWDLALTPATKKEIVESFKERYGEWIEEKDARKRANMRRPTPRGLQGYHNISNERIPDDAVIWGGKWQTGLHSTPNIDGAVASISDFLEHTVDYIVANNLEDKLDRYDMQRLVRETMEWDEATRKKAEKQRAITDSKLKTYIQFPDGYRWVRLDSPGQFAAESDMMGHSVRGYEPSKQKHGAISWFDLIVDNKDKTTIAEEYQKLVNTISSRGGIPISFGAWLGRHPKYREYLNDIPEDAGEGGHAYYGYGGWEAIKKDNARIYSLRDPKGKSVVTVELGKDSPEIPSELTRTNKFEVSQIKGRYNESPDPSLHPKIQDLLRNLNEESLLNLDETREPENAGLAMFNYDEGAHFIPIEEWSSMREPSRLAHEPLSEFLNRKDADIKAMPNQLTIPPTTKRVGDRSLDSRAKGVSKRTVGAWDDTAASIFKMLVDPNKGIGEEGFATREYWRLRSGEFRDKAEGYTVRINRALKRDGIDKVEFEKAIAKAEAQPTYASRERALDGLVRQYGKAAHEYREGRLLIDNFSKEILREWYREITATGRKAGKKEINTMNQLAERLGKYAHRVYLATIPGMGEDYAEGILQAYDKGLTKNPYYDVVKKGIEYLVDHEVAIPEAKYLHRKATPTVRRMYQTWIGPAGALSKQEMIDALQEKREDLTPELVDRMVIKIVREMLGLEGDEEMGPISRYYRGGAIDESTLKTRKNVPQALRALLGEVTDPAQRILITISAQADLLFKQRMLQDYYDNYEGKLWVRPGDRAKPENAKFTEELTGETYGPLSGMFVTKPFAYAIRSARTQVMELRDALSMTGLDATIPTAWLGSKIPKAIGKLSQFQKMSKTVFDFGAWSFNAMGSPINLLSKGQVLGTTKYSRQALLDALILGLQAMGVEHKHNKETTDRLAVLLGHGIPDSVFTAELRDSEREFYQKLLTELNRDALSGHEKTKAAVIKIIRAARDNYGLADSWVKIADFYAMQDYYKSYYEANGGLQPTQEAINRMAADRVKKRNITYSRSPLLVQAFERSGATVFLTFASEVIRVMMTTPLTIKDSLVMAKNAKTPEAKNIAMKDAIETATGYSIAMALIPYVSHQLINRYFNGEDDEEKAKEERERFLKLWFETDQDQSFVVLGKNAEGGVVMLNASRIDPNGHATDFIRQAAQGDDPEEYWNSVKNLLLSPAGNGYMDDVWNALTRKGAKDSRLADHLGPVQEAFRKLYEWAPILERDDADRVTRVLDNFYPGFMRSFDRVRDEYVAPGTDKTRIVEPAPGVDPDVANAWTALGMRTTVIDPKKIAAFEVNQFNTNRARVVALWNDMVKRDGLTYDDVVRTALDIYVKEEASAIRMADVYSGLDTDLAGVNPRKVLQDSNLNAEDINDAALGRYRSVVLSRSRMAESEKRLLSQTDDREERRKIRENFRLARQVLADLDLETR